MYKNSSCHFKNDFAHPNPSLTLPKDIGKLL